MLPTLRPKRLRVPFRTATLANLALLTLLGCTDATTRATLTGNYQALSDTANAPAFELTALRTNEVWAYCQAFMKAREFDRFDACIIELDKRVAEADGNLLYLVQGLGGNQFIAYGAFAEGMIGTLKAEAAQARGDQETAYDLSEDVADLTRTFAYPNGRRQLLEDGSSPRLADLDESWFFWIERLKHQAAALGRQGLISAQWGDTSSARAFAAEIKAIDDTSMSAEQWLLPETKALWLGRIYIELGDYEAAYEATHRADPFGLYEVLSGASAFVTVADPIWFVSWLEMTGSADPFALEFVERFEPRFMQHLSELETGRLEMAAAGYEAILAEDRIHGFGTVHWQALYGRGRIAALQGNREAAIADFKAAVEVIESQRRSLDTEAGRIGFVGDKQNVYSDLIALLIETNRVDEAFGFAERAKARALVDLLASRDALGADVLSSRQTALLSAFDAEESTRTIEARASGGGMVARSSNSAFATLLAEDPNLASLVSVEAFSADELRALVPEDETLLHYYMEGGSLFAFVVTQDRVVSHVLDADSLAPRVAAFRRSLGTPGDQGYIAPGQALYAQLVEPLLADVRTEKVTIVPHGSLHYLSWAALPDEAGFLLDRWSIRVLPNASVLKFVEPGTSDARPSMLALGNPATGDPRLNLPGAEREARAIANAVPGVRTLLRGQATETAIKTQGGSARTLHIASHGVFQPTDPLASALVLSPDGQNDGRLTVAEIYGLNLEADLVTLSACETGLGRVQNGDDVIGLTRGFLFSGARAVVASQWLIDDAATADLMETFYTGRASLSAREALRRAQTRIRDSYNGHPYYWAAFQLTGQDV